jgi:8-oxo-dGTP diphosphatase
MPATRPITRVRAAGGIVVRRARKGPKVLLIHRPGYNDWSFPKGKVDKGETFKQAALREVVEETGYHCTVHKPRLASLQYYDGSGRSKEVRYWIMTVDSGKFVPNKEVDEIDWVRLNKVESKLSYSRDRRLYRAVLKSGRLDTVV